MGNRKPGKNARRRAGGKTASSRIQERNKTGRDAPGAGGMAGPSRLRLTRILRDGVIWEVYVTTTPRSAAENITLLEFEGSTLQEERVRYSRPVVGALLDALHNGRPVSRSDLEEELELAIREAG
jgi:hypothetical protein